MKFSSLLFFALTSILFVRCAGGQGEQVNTKLSAQEFSDKLKQTQGAQLVDVRTPGEFEKGHITDAKNIDWNGDDFQAGVSKLDKTKPVFVYCLSGGRSTAAAAKMRTDGFKEVYELNGGIMKWRAAGLPEATGNAPASTGMSKAQFELLMNTPKILVIDFYADWCEPCKKMKPYLDSISAAMPDKVEIIRINADENKDLCKSLNVDGLPVLQIYKNKVLTWTHTGFISKEDFLKELKKN